MVPRSRVGAALLMALPGVVVGVAGLGTARAQGAPVALAWSAPDECPAEASVRRAVEQLLGDGPAPAAHVTASAVVTRGAADRWRVHLTTVRDGVRGERDVESPSCQSLADATALIVAMTIDPERVAARAPAAAAASASASAAAPASAAPSASASAAAPAPGSASAAAPAPSPAPTPPPEPAPAPSPTPAASRPTLLAVLAETGLDTGTLPSTAYVLRAAIALTLDPFRVEAYGTYLPSQSAHDAAIPSLGTNVRLLAGGARGCFFPLRRPWLEAGGCAGLELGELHGDGFGTLRSPYSTFTPASGGSVWIAPTLDARAAWRIAPAFSLVLDVEGLVPLQRPPFVIDSDTTGGGALHQAGVVEGRAAIGPEIRF